MTLTIQDSKPLVEQLEAISKVAVKFASLQKSGFAPVRQLQEILP